MLGTHRAPEPQAAMAAMSQMYRQAVAAGGRGGINMPYLPFPWAGETNLL
jgi:hypothetical protein